MCFLDYRSCVYSGNIHTATQKVMCACTFYMLLIFHGPKESVESECIGSQTSDDFML